MKFNKSLIALAVTGALAVPGIQHAQAAEHTFNWGGNLRLQSTSETKTVESTEEDVETLTTSFGGLDDESTTGGDTHIQLGYGYTSDDAATTGSGFIRFASDRQVRLNVEASSEGDTYAASMKAEWEQLGLDGASDRWYNGTDVLGDDKSITERDQFAILTHKPTGLYFKIGREEWLGNEKGYTTDFLSATSSYSDVGIDGRFAGHLLGWSSSDLGLDVGLLIQRSNSGQDQSGKPLGFAFDEEVVDETADVNGFGLSVKYAAGPVDAELFSGSATAAANKDRGDSEDEQGVAITQLHVALAFGNYKPFLNFGSSTLTKTIGEADELEATASGNNLGISIGFGFADLVVAFGSATAEAYDKKETTNSGFDLMFATNTDPLLVSLAYTSDTQEVTPEGGEAVETTTAQYGVRFDYGF